MEVERIATGLRRGTQPPPKQVPPVKVKKLVSIVDVFKQTLRKTKVDSANPKRVDDDSRAVVGKAADDKAPHFKSQSSSRSPKKVSSRVSKKSDLHPLALTFKSTYEDHQFMSCKELK
jgi:hypothetical protein